MLVLLVSLPEWLVCNHPCRQVARLADPSPVTLFFGFSIQSLNKPQKVALFALLWL
jgi:hypothetical protein